MTFDYPDAYKKEKVGTYDLEVFSGAGYVYDYVLEYRVWYKKRGRTFCASFDNYNDALAYHRQNKKSEEPIVLVLQKEYVNEPEPGKYVLVNEERITEWQPEWLRDGLRTKEKVNDLLSKSR